MASPYNVGSSFSISGQRRNSEVNIIQTVSLPPKGANPNGKTETRPDEDVLRDGRRRHEKKKKRKKKKASSSGRRRRRSSSSSTSSSDSESDDDDSSRSTTSTSSDEKHRRRRRGKAKKSKKKSHRDERSEDNVKKRKPAKKSVRSESQEVSEVEEMMPEVKKEEAVSKTSSFGKLWSSSSSDEEKKSSEAMPAALKKSPPPSLRKTLTSKSKFADVEFIPLGSKSVASSKNPVVTDPVRPKASFSLQRPIFRAPEKVSFARPVSKTRPALPGKVSQNVSKPSQASDYEGQSIADEEPKSPAFQKIEWVPASSASKVPGVTPLRQTQSLAPLSRTATKPAPVKRQAGRNSEVPRRALSSPACDFNTQALNQLVPATKSTPKVSSETRNDPPQSHELVAADATAAVAKCQKRQEQVPVSPDPTEATTDDPVPVNEAALISHETVVQVPEVGLQAPPDGTDESLGLRPGNSVPAAVNNSFQWSQPPHLLRDSGPTPEVSGSCLGF